MCVLGPALSVLPASSIPIQGCLCLLTEVQTRVMDSVFSRLVNCEEVTKIWPHEVSNNHQGDLATESGENCNLLIQILFQVLCVHYPISLSNNPLRKSLVFPFLRHYGSEKLNNLFQTKQLLNNGTAQHILLKRHTFQTQVSNRNEC